MRTHHSTPAAATRPGARRLGVLSLVLAATLVACRDDSPTGIGGPRETLERPTPPTPIENAGFVFSPRAHAIAASSYQLLSSAAEVERGELRYHVLDTSARRWAPDDLIVTELHGERVVRRVLDARTLGDTLVLDTGPGFWSDVVRSGTHRVTVPFDGNAPGIVTDAGILLDPVDYALPGVPIPELGIENRTFDLCALIQELAGAAGAICGNAGSQSISYGVELELEGRLDSLVLKDVTLGVAGDMDLAMSVDGGGLVGGTPPTFYPCNLRAYLGCVSTPTGAALITWLRQYAPNVPEASLPPVRVCVPGLPVRLRAGYWDRSGWIPRWVPPTFTTCRISNVGVLPEVVLPSAGSADLTVRPQVTGGMTVRVRGDVKLTAKIPLGPLGVSAGKGGDRLSAKGTVGFFVLLSIELRNTAAEVRFDFDNLSTIVQHWGSTDGWSGDYTNETSNFAGELLDLGPDSIVFRVGVLAEVSGTLCAGISGCDPGGNTSDSSSSAAIAEDHLASALTDLNVGAFVKVSEINFIDAIRTQEALGPADSGFVIGKVAVLRGKEIPVGAGITIPFKDFFTPPVPLTWERTFGLDPLPVATRWEEVGFNASVATTGVNLDPDGYRLVVERTDTMPKLYVEGATRIGAARDHGEAQAWDIDPTDVVLRPRPQHYRGCTVAYTDALKPLSWPAYAGRAVSESLTGWTLPTWFVALPCPMLAGNYRFTLEDVADNCEVLGGNGKEFWIPGVQPLAGRPGAVSVELAVECSAATPTGSVQVTTNLHDTEFDPLPYALRINGRERGPIAGSASRTISGVEAGSVQVSLVGGSGQCAIPASVDVTVVADATVEVAFDGPCSAPDLPPPPPGTVVLSPVVTGATTAESFLAVLDGSRVQQVPASGSASFSDVTGAQLSVIDFVDVDPSCRPTTPLPMVFDLGAPVGVAELQPTFVCTDAPISTMAGTVERASGGAVGVSIRLATGAVQPLTGALVPELEQLEGAAVRIWGASAGLALSVHGYALVSTLTEPRVTGVLVERDGEFWILGGSAVRLSSPPGALTALVGDLVWVGGATQADASLRPTVFGLLRSIP